MKHQQEIQRYVCCATNLAQVRSPYKEKYLSGRSRNIPLHVCVNTNDIFLEGFNWLAFYRPQQIIKITKEIIFDHKQIMNYHQE